MLAPSFDRFTLLSALIFFAANLSADPAQAQARDPHPVATTTAATVPGEALVTLPGIGGASLKGAAFQTLLDASSDEKTGTAVVGWKNGANVYSLTFKGPLNSKTKETTPISLEGLSNGTSFQLAFSHLGWHGPDLDEQAEIKQICQRHTGRTSCDDNQVPAGADHKRLIELLHLNDIPWYFGLSGGLSMTKYTFRLAPELKEDSDTRTDASATVRVGLYRPTIGFVIGSLGWQKTSSPGADPVSLCQPLEGTNASTCSQAVLQKPGGSKTSKVAALELRRKLAGDVTIAPKVQRDIERKVTAVIFPVYFMKDTKGSLIGGLRGSWRSDTKAVVISLFVGGAFALTPSAQ